MGVLTVPPSPAETAPSSPVSSSPRNWAIGKGRGIQLNSLDRGCGDGGRGVNCKACNTRLSGSQRVCPNCGRADGSASLSDSAKAPGAEATEVGPLSPSSLSANLSAMGAAAESSLFSGDDADFEEEIDMALRETTPSPKAAPVARSADKADKKRKAPKKAKAADPGAGAESSRRLNRAPVSVVIPVDGEQVRHLIVERPEVLEADLSVHVDEEGVEVGAGFETEVGEIDLLARSADGTWVVAMVVTSPAEQENIIAGMIQRIGWVRKHLSDGQEEVRGVVLTGTMSDELVYAATALKDSVSFLGWRLSLGFESLAP